MNLTPLYVGTLMVIALLVIEYRAIRRVIEDAARLRRIFSFRPSYLRSPRLPAPMDRRLGARIPDFAAREVQSNRLVDRDSLLGASTMLVFFRAVDLGTRRDSVWASFIHDCRVKVNGDVYVVFDHGDRHGQPLGVESMRAESEEGVVFVDDGHNGLWQALGILTTPCAILLDEDGVIRSYGQFTERESVATPEPFGG